MSRIKKSIALGLLTVAAFFATGQNQSQAQDFYIPVVYKVEVQYWFFDTDHYHWSTKLETTNRSQASLYYFLLQLAKQQGTLNDVVPNSYWRYIAVDVRMTREFIWFPYYPYRLTLAGDD